MIHSFAVIVSGVDLTDPDSPHADALFETAIPGARVVRIERLESAGLLPHSA